MNKRQIIKQLKQKYPGKKIICLPKNSPNPSEIICELGPIDGGSRAIAVISRSELHYHRRTTEIYRVLKGELLIEYDSTDKACVFNPSRKRLNPGQSFTIHPGTLHCATGDAVWVEVDAFPAWTPDDHHLVHLAD